MKVVQKFHYLKTALSGDALQLIETLQIDDKNYDLALQLLKSRFSNRNVMALAHIRALHELSQLTKESFIQLQKCVDTFQKHISSLDVMKIDYSCYLLNNNLSYCHLNITNEILHNQLKSF